MTASHTDPQPAAAPAGAGTTRVRIRFILTFFLANAGMFAVFQGMQQILVPTRVAEIDPEGKIASLGLLASLGALAAALGSPLFGALSDRTRSRFGRRAPWILLAAALVLVLMALMANMTDLFWVGAGYIGVMLTASAFQAAITAVIPDRVPENRRGLVSSVIGVATFVGVLFGINVATAFLGVPILAYTLVASLLVVGAILFVILAPDAPATQALPRPEGSLVHRVGRFFSGLRDHDLAWAFWARVAIMLGFWTVSTYQLYTLSDYIGVENLPEQNPAVAVAVLGSINLVISLISTVIAGPLSDRANRRKIFVVIASVGMGVAAIVPLVWPTFLGMLVYGALLGFFFGIFTAVDQAIMTLVLPRQEDAARDLGMLNVATSGPQIAGPFVAALLLGIFGGFPALFIFSAVTALLSAFFILPIRKVR